jgi:hypothetical protein
MLLTPGLRNAFVAVAPICSGYPGVQERIHCGTNAALIAAPGSVFETFR